MWRMPGTIHRVEKRSSNGNTLCAWNNSSCRKAILKWNICARPGTIRREEKRSCSENIFVRLEQFNVCENDPEVGYFCAPETIHRVDIF